MSASYYNFRLFAICAKNCQIWWKFDIVITKIILLVCLRHGVLLMILSGIGIGDITFLINK